MSGKQTSKKRKTEKLITGYNYEEIYSEEINQVNEIFRASVSNAECYKHKYVSKKIESGNQLEVEIYPGFLASIEMPKYLKEDRSTSSEKQKKYNTKQTYKKIERIAHANFGEGDWNITLTFARKSKPKSKEETRKEFMKFMRRVNAKRKKKGLPGAKYIFVMEVGLKNKDWHIHMLMDNLLAIEDVILAWKKNGTVDFSSLTYSKSNEGEKNFVPLCRYITKHKDTYPKLYKNGKKWEIHWGRSRGNLESPKEQEQKTPIAKKVVKKLTAGEKVDQLNAARQIFEQRYKSYEFVDIEVRTNENYDGLYFIHVRMQKRSGSNLKNKRVRI